ncbi:pyroglutamyl-peptidase I [Maritalea mediterranea]|uniref:Pyroglutamyl-peptidase I n=1 Tax=Maritalea mediterranea TaxID=2909667 RepID=A0ABS9E478_9HYPH|nr:pyroglutamyl-peptidase I [Maritalea mediterranea]MCF4097670.1 pyroglutamyl-peptidase I [Maritalea mediterranea]
MKILLTGFEPFGGEQHNPAQQLARALDGETHESDRIVSGILPVARYGAINAMQQLIDEHQPQMVVALGVAAGREGITPEKVAINFDDYRIADNQGNQPMGEPVVENGPNAYFSTLPINLMVKEMAHLVPAGISFSAGTFVCNHLMYGLMHHCAQHRPSMRAGFIHVPQATENLPPEGAGDLPHLPLAQMIEALERAIFAAAAHKGDDLKRHAGGTH